MLGVEMALKEAEGQKAEAGDWSTGMFEVYGPLLSVFVDDLNLFPFKEARGNAKFLSGEFRKEKNADVFLVAHVG